MTRRATPNKLPTLAPITTDDGVDAALEVSPVRTGGIDDADASGICITASEGTNVGGVVASIDADSTGVLMTLLPYVVEDDASAVLAELRN